MELFSIPCPTCGARLKVKSLAALGQIFNCPKCQSMLLVEAPAGWKPPPQPSVARPATKPRVAAASTAAIPESLEMPVATIDEAGGSDPVIPIEEPWQSVAEPRWRQPAVLGGAAFTAVLIGAAAWFWWPESTPAEALVPRKLVAQEPADPPPLVEESVAAAPVEPAVIKEESPPAAPALPRRWFPPDTRLVLSLPLSSLAAHEAAPEVLASGSSPLRQTLSDLRTTFHLLPEQIRQLTWAATESSADLRDSLIVIELAQPLEDDAALVAGCQRIDLQLADAVAHQPAPRGWPHPFAIVDPSTIVTGPLELLSSLDRAGNAPLEHASFAAAVDRAWRTLPASALPTQAASATARPCTLTVDLQHWTGWEQLQWPAPIEELLSSQDAWQVLQEAPRALSLTIDPAEQATVELHLLCDGPQSAEKVKLALEEAVKNLAEKSQVSVDGNVVTCRLPWPDDSRQLAASLLANLPKWQAPVPPAAVAVSPDPLAPTQPPPAAAGETPFARQVARRFDERIPAIALRGMKLADFAAFVSRLSGVTIAVDEGVIAAADSQPSIEVQLTAATIGEVLTAALSAHDLDYVAEDNRLLITTTAKAKAARSK